MLKRSLIRRKGPRSVAWDAFADQYADECRDSANLINCAATDHDPECPRRLYRPDLHHSRGRDGKLMFNKRYLVWLSRLCHEREHAKPKNNASWRPGPQSDADNH